MISELFCPCFTLGHLFMCYLMLTFTVNQYRVHWIPSKTYEDATNPESLQFTGYPRPKAILRMKNVDFPHQRCQCQGEWLLPGRQVRGVISLLTYSSASRSVTSGFIGNTVHFVTRICRGRKVVTGYLLKFHSNGHSPCLESTKQRNHTWILFVHLSCQQLTLSAWLIYCLCNE